MDSSARLVACIDLDRLTENWRNLDRFSGKANTAAVVKANGYGHGMRAVALCLHHGGCRHFFTASMEEAVTLRDSLPDAWIGCFDGLTRHDAASVLEHAIIPSVNAPEELEILADLAAKRGAPVPAMIQVDTGLNRLGCGGDHLAEFPASPHFKAGSWQLVYSHLASADEPGKPQSSEQKAGFDEALRHFPGIPASLAATGGIMLGEGFHYSLTRPGIGLYGLAPVPELTAHLKPALSLHARILQIREAREGEHVGYNATFRLERPSRLATVAGGYADGIRRELSNNGFVHAKGLSAPIIGRVSMDTTIVDITDWPEDHLIPGGYVDFLHDGYTAEDMAKAAGTIAYDVLTALGLRAKRHYAGEVLNSIHL